MLSTRRPRIHLAQLLDAKPQAAHARLLVRTWKQKKHVQHLTHPILGDAQVCTVQPVDETHTGVGARCVKQKRAALALSDLSLQKFPVVQPLGAPVGCSGRVLHGRRGRGALPANAVRFVVLGELEDVLVHLPVARQLHQESPILQRLSCSPSSLGVSGPPRTTVMTRHCPRLRAATVQGPHHQGHDVVMRVP